jgi:hypothetical protein
MGALTHQDIAALRESCIQRLPDDNHGQAVYIIKASTIASSSLTSSGTRALFYQLHLSNEAGRILLLVDALSYNTDRSLDDLKAFFSLLSELVCKALPLKVIRLLIISSPSTTPARSMHSEYIIQLLAQSFSLSTQVVVVKEDSHQDLVSKLESFGLTKAGISSVLGGTTFGSSMLDHPQYESYLHLNAAHGSRRAEDAPLSPAEELISSSRSIQEKEGKASQAPPSALKRRLSSSSQEQGSNNKKIKAYSHTKNNGSWCKKDDSPLYCPQEDSEATALQLNPQRQEEEEEAVVDNEEANKETIRNFKKQRNAFYSRRKYERKKIEIEVMKKEAGRHRTQHVNLLQEQQRLKQLYAKAIKCINKQQENEQQKRLILGRKEEEEEEEGVVQQQGRRLQQQQPTHASILAAAACGGSPPAPGGNAAAIDAAAAAQITCSASPPALDVAESISDCSHRHGGGAAKPRRDA